MSRRNFLRVMGASMALAGLAGCARSNPPDEIVPYTVAPEETELGRPTFFSSTMPFDGYGRGVLVISREGRPIKIEGNPDHPGSLGATDVFMQASVLDLYDPDRAQTVTQAGVGRDISEFHREIAEQLNKSNGGEGIGLLSRNVSSPMLVAQIEQFRRRYPKAKWYVHDPMARSGEGEPASAVFEKSVDVIYDFKHAKVIASLDCDFLITEPGSLQYARQFSDARRVRKNNQSMNRLYMVESALSATGSMADHRLPLNPSQIVDVAKALALAVGAGGASQAPKLPGQAKRWVDALAADLKAAGPGQSLVIPGRFQPAAVHALAHAINKQLGNDGKTVSFIEPVAGKGDGSLKSLVADLNDKAVNTLLILDGNPVYDSPADIDFTKALSDVTKQVKDGSYVAFTAHLSSHFNETSYCCQWHIPMSHWLESWGDARAFDGTVSLIQPLIAPLYSTVSPWQMMDMMLGMRGRGDYTILQQYWQGQVHGNYDAWWLKTLQKGIVEGTAAKTVAMPAIRTEVISVPRTAAISRTAKQVDLVFRPDTGVWTGEFTNNAWMQECPRPFTKLTWDNAMGINIAMAKQLGKGDDPLKDGDMIRLTACGKSLEGPIIVIPGQADGVVSLTLGYGRSRGGTLVTDEGTPRGYNAFALRTAADPWSISNAEFKVTGKYYQLATAQNHHAMADIDPDAAGISPMLKPNVVAKMGMSDQELSLTNRKLIRTVTLEQYQKNPKFMDVLAPEEKKPVLSLFPDLPKEASLQWGMVIDTSACMGCNSCVIACQAENNIPVVGKEQVILEREMHWIRIDDYFDGSAEDPKMYHEPVPCMQCEDAPCEIVCPVGATTTSPEGINEMTYNRCVGTRFCSNNCPYKVRRFNFFLYSDYTGDTKSLQFNPDVSVRSRGVMEKCTYCIQRIDRTRVDMEREMLELRGLARNARTAADRDRFNAQAEKRGREVVERLETACQQSCPARAISFGNIDDPHALVTKQKKEPANYVLLRDLTTKPRTSYLAHVSNPNPSLAGGSTV